MMREIRLTKEQETAYENLWILKNDKTYKEMKSLETKCSDILKKAAGADRSNVVLMSNDGTKELARFELKSEAKKKFDEDAFRKENFELYERYMTAEVPAVWTLKV